MSYKFAKQLAMATFAASTVSMLLQHLVSLFIYNFSANVVTGFLDVLSIIFFMSVIATAGSFVLMWLMGGSILDAMVGGLMALGIVARIFFPIAPSVGALDFVTIFPAIEMSLYLLVWAYKHFRKNPMMSMLLVGAFVLAVISTPIVNFLLIELMLNRVICILFVSIPIEIIVGGIKIYAIMNESESKSS